MDEHEASMVRMGFRDPLPARGGGNRSVEGVGGGGGGGGSGNGPVARGRPNGRRVAAGSSDGGSDSVEYYVYGHHGDDAGAVGGGGHETTAVDAAAAALARMQAKHGITPIVAVGPDESKQASAPADRSADSGGAKRDSRPAGVRSAAATRLDRSDR